MINTKKDNLNLITEYLKNNKVLVLPTDTIYGLSCRSGSAAAIKKIYSIKERPDEKPLLLLVSSRLMLKKYFYVSKKQLEYLHQVWAKGEQPTTIILRPRYQFSPKLIYSDGGVAVRLPKSDFLTKIIRLIGEPIISTSLNISRKKNLTSVENLGEYFTRSKPDLVVNAGVILGQPSRIIDIRDINNIKIIRN